MPEKQKYQKNMQKQIHKLQDQIDELKHHAATAGDDMKTMLNQRAVQLQDEMAGIKTKFRDLETNGKESWEDLRKKIDAAVHDLKNGVTAAKARFTK